MYSVQAAVEHLNKHARPKPMGDCAKFVREAIAAGGIDLPRGHAESFFMTLGNWLKPAGFVEILGGVAACNSAQTGDVAVMWPAISIKAHGHIAMYNGRMWVSDGLQPRGVYPNEQYRAYRPEIRLFRPSMAKRGPLL
jgi:hypothetical protein